MTKEAHVVFPAAGAALQLAADVNAAGAGYCPVGCGGAPRAGYWHGTVIVSVMVSPQPHIHVHVLFSQASLWLAQYAGRLTCPRGQMPPQM